MYLVMYRHHQPTVELQYKLFLECFILYCKEKSNETREWCQEAFDEGLEESCKMFQRYLPQEIKDEVEDWKAFSVGYISQNMWQKLKDFYEETYNEKFKIKRAGTR